MLCSTLRTHVVKLEVHGLDLELGAVNEHGVADQETFSQASSRSSYSKSTRNGYVTTGRMGSLRSWTMPVGLGWRARYVLHAAAYLSYHLPRHAV